MKATKLIKITTPKQFEMMVELLEQKPQLAQSYHSGLHKIDTKEEWREISNKLNCLGPPFRTGPQWMKVWADFKCNLKKKILHNKIEVRATGGGSNKQYNLTAVEEAASALLQLNSIISPEGGEIGIKESTPKDEAFVLYDLDENKEIVAGSSKNSITPKKLTKNVSAKTEIIEQQLKVQTELYKEVKENLKQIERYSRKQLKVQEETLSLYKSEIKRKKEKFDIYKIEKKKKAEHRKLLLQLKADEVALKKRQIELEEYKQGLNKL